MHTQKNQLMKPIQAKLRVIIQIAHQEIVTKPQYPDTQIRLMEFLIRSFVPGISIKKKLYLLNWTKGPKIGRQLDPKETLQDMLEGTEGLLPKIRVQWSNPQCFTVIVDVHDTLVLTYQKMNKFYYVQDLLNSIRTDLIKKLYLSVDTTIKVKTSGVLQKAERMSFVGLYLNIEPGAMNRVKVYLKFYEEDIPKQFVEAESKIEIEKLYCPISHMLMQQPVDTQCHHTFDKLWISLNIYREQKCPICRQIILLSQLIKNKEVDDEISQLKAKWREFKKGKKEEEDKI